MPSHLSADPSSALPAGRGAMDALITQARRLKGEVVAVRRETPGDTADPQGRWERALCDLALHQLTDLNQHLAQLRDGPPPSPAPDGAGAAGALEPAGAPHGSPLSRVGSAEWNLLTDEAGWSVELYRILGLDPAGPARTLDELPSLVLDADRPRLTALVTDCLVDARPVEGEFRVVRPDGAVRTVHLMGEPVLDADGATAAMWAVLRDVSELRRSQSAVRETRDSLHRDRPAHDGPRLAVEPGQAALPPWRGFPRLPHPGGPALDLAALGPPAPAGPQVPGGWCDALELSDGATVLTAGALADPGPGGAADPAMPLGALRGMALAGADPARQLACLGQLLTAVPGPSLARAVCCRYRPEGRALEWAWTGGPAPLLFRAGTGRVLDAPKSARSGAGQAETVLGAGDVLVLHTGSPASGQDEPDTVRRLLALAPRFQAARGARDCVRAVLAEFGGSGHADGLDVLVARVLP